MTPNDPQLHPDSIRIVFVTSRMDLEEDRYVRRLNLWDGDTHRPLTAGPGDRSPRISPDGETVAFLRTVDGKPQLAMLPLTGGEAEVVTALSHGVSDPRWSPDGSRIAFVAGVTEPHEEGVDAEELARRPRRITRFPYRFDDMGWLRPEHLHVLDVASGDVTRLTDGEHGVRSPVWHPDGTELAFLSARHETAGLDEGTQVWTIPAGGGEATARTDVGLWEAPTYSQEGALHACGGGPVNSDPSLYPFVRIAEDGPHVPVIADQDRNIVFYSTAMAPGSPQWLADGSVVVPVEDSGTVRIERVHADGEREVVLGGNRVVTGASPSSDGSVVAFAATTATNPGEIWLLDAAGERRVTSFNDVFAADMVEPSSFTISHEGVEIQGWVYLPPGEETVPVLFNIHGGPASQYGWGFFDEFQVYAGAGYGVVAINPRGSSGYGLEHVRAVVGTWQDERSPDMRDLLAAVDTAVASQPRLDPDRAGIMGGSYGGLATVRILAMDQRYRSAVAERGLYTWPSFTGTSDIGPWFAHNYFDADVDWETLWAASPLAGADRITTPTLVLHSEGDWRTPVEQGEQLFVALLRNGVDTEFVRFPATEGHNLSRTGSPRHRKERFEVILEWHGRYL